MRIVYLAAGAGSIYCGSCLQGNTLARALRRRGCDAVLVPLYTPLRTDEEDLSGPRVGMGGINLYLEQYLPAWGRLPAAVRRFFDHPGLLRWAANRPGSTRAEGLGAMTVSMLRGEEGRQRRELAAFVDWLARDLRPDLVHLNNLLLIGVARSIRARLGVPVVATLSGEDVFLERLPPHFRDEARDVLRKRAAELAGLSALNRYFADAMADYLTLPRERVQVIPPGLDLADYADLADSSGRGDVSAGLAPTIVNAAAPSPAGFRVGYLARICHDKGLHLLVEALGRLRAQSALGSTTVTAAGTLHPDDRAYLLAVRRRAAELGVGDQFEYLGELDRPQKLAFLRTLDLFCLPTVYRESKGLPLYEACAQGIPAILPAHGAFPEIVTELGGGRLFEPHSPAALAEAIRSAAGDLPGLRAQGRAAAAIVRQRFTADALATRTLQWYEAVIGAFQ